MFEGVCALVQLTAHDIWFACLCVCVFASLCVCMFVCLRMVVFGDSFGYWRFSVALRYVKFFLVASVPVLGGLLCIRQGAANFSSSIGALLAQRLSHCIGQSQEAKIGQWLLP